MEEFHVDGSRLEATHAISRTRPNTSPAARWTARAPAVTSSRKRKQRAKSRPDAKRGVRLRRRGGGRLHMTKSPLAAQRRRTRERQGRSEGRQHGGGTGRCRPGTVRAPPPPRAVSSSGESLLSDNQTGRQPPRATVHHMVASEKRAAPAAAAAVTPSSGRSGRERAFSITTYDTRRRIERDAGGGGNFGSDFRESGAEENTIPARGGGDVRQSKPLDPKLTRPQTRTPLSFTELLRSLPRTRG